MKKEYEQSDHQVIFCSVKKKRVVQVGEIRTKTQQYTSWQDTAVIQQ